MSSTALFRTETEIARRKVAWHTPIQIDTSLGTISLRITDDFSSVEELWEGLQAIAPCSPAQTFGYARAFARHVLGPEGREPVIVVGTGADGQTLFLWAFEMGSTMGLRVLNWLGQSQANYTMGLFAPGVAASFKAEDISRTLSEVARRVGAAAAVLKGQPVSWDGIENPFAKLPHQLAPNSGYAVKLGDFAELFHRRFSKRSRSNIDRKERKLAEVGPIVYGWAETRAERLQLIDIFFAQKARQFAAMGVKEVFDVHARAFYRELALLEGDNPSRLRLGYIKVGDVVAATFSGAICHDRLSVALSSLGDGEVQKQSPGALLLRHQIEEASAQGLALYDIGAGAARHKEQWCDLIQPLFDSFIAFKLQGVLLTLPHAAMARVKRTIKSNRHLWSLAQRLRRTLMARETEAQD